MDNHSGRHAALPHLIVNPVRPPSGARAGHDMKTIAVRGKVSGAMSIRASGSALFSSFGTFVCRAVLARTNMVFPGFEFLSQPLQYRSNWYQFQHRYACVVQPLWPDRQLHVLRSNARSWKWESHATSLDRLQIIGRRKPDIVGTFQVSYSALWI